MGRNIVMVIYKNFIWLKKLNILNLKIECGLFRKKPNARIVGGVEALPDSWPSAALIIASYKADIPYKSCLKISNINIMK